MKFIQHKNRLIKYLGIGLLLVGIIGTVLFILEKNQFINIFGDNKSTTDNTQTTSEEPSAQSSFSNGGEREIIQSNKNEGFVTDSNGDVPSIPPQSQWSVSKSGIITVYGPIQNSILKNGQSITGKSTSSTVNFRLIDDATGVIAEGNLKVINGQYAGTFDFDTKASEGRLDVFTANTDGVESNVVEIAIRFK